MTPPNGASRSRVPPAVCASARFDDFEDVPVGSAAVTDELYEDAAAGAVIRVTDKRAHGGARSLAFYDKAGLERTCQPHLVYRPRFENGVLVAEFDVFIEPGALFYHEWRDWGDKLFAGPSIRIGDDGQVQASGTPVGKVPLNRWLHVRVVCGTGAQLTGTWHLEITTPGAEKPLAARDLKCHPQFRVMNWIGFIALADADAVFYLDDLRLGPRGGEDAQ